MNKEEDYPIKSSVALRISHKPFFGPEHDKKPEVYDTLPISDISKFPLTNCENAIIHLAGFVTPFFGWKMIEMREDLFPDAIYENKNKKQIKVEFEKHTKDFIEHKHPPEGCDYILCWEDNLNTKEKKDRIYSRNPNLKIIQLKRIFHNYEFKIIEGI